MNNKFETEVKGESLEDLKRFINIYFDNFKTVKKTFKNGVCHYNEYIRISFINEWIKYIKSKQNGTTYYEYTEKDKLVGFMHVENCHFEGKDSVQIRIYHFEKEEDLKDAFEFLTSIYGIDEVLVSIPSSEEIIEDSFLDIKRVLCGKDVNIYRIKSKVNKLRLKNE